MDDPSEKSSAAEKLEQLIRESFQECRPFKTVSDFLVSLDGFQNKRYYLAGESSKVRKEAASLNMDDNQRKMVEIFHVMVNMFTELGGCAERLRHIDTALFNLCNSDGGLTVLINQASHEAEIPYLESLYGYGLYFGAARIIMKKELDQLGNIMDGIEKAKEEAEHCIKNYAHMEEFIEIREDLEEVHKSLSEVPEINERLNVLHASWLEIFLKGRSLLGFV